jgi:hypothetical protein
MCYVPEGLEIVGRMIHVAQNARGIRIHEDDAVVVGLDPFLQTSRSFIKGPQEEHRQNHRMATLAAARSDDDLQRVVTKGLHALAIDACGYAGHVRRNDQDPRRGPEAKLCRRVLGFGENGSVNAGGLAFPQTEYRIRLVHRTIHWT